MGRYYGKKSINDLACGQCQSAEQFSGDLACSCDFVNSYVRASACHVYGCRDLIGSMTVHVGTACVSAPNALIDLSGVSSCYGHCYCLSCADAMIFCGAVMTVNDYGNDRACCDGDSIGMKTMNTLNVCVTNQNHRCDHLVGYSSVALDQRPAGDAPSYSGA